MQRYILTRLFYAFISLMLLSVTIFVMIRITGDPVVLMADPGAKEEDLQALRVELGLDRTYVQQYVIFITKLARGNFGKSFMYRIPVFELYMQRLPASILLAGAAMAISIILGIPLGIFAAVRVNTWLDSFCNIFANLGLATPSFWLGIMLMLVFAVNLQWLPVQGSGTIKHIIMPAVALGLVFTAANMRLARSAMLEVLGSEYIKLARIKGLTESLVILKHAFKNAIIPVLTFACLNFALTLQGSVVVESIFAWPGVGRLLFEGISSRDFPIVQATVILGGVMIIFVNLLVDLLYAYIDPRIRYGQ